MERGAGAPVFRPPSPPAGGAKLPLLLPFAANPSSGASFTTGCYLPAPATPTTYLECEFV